MQPACDRDRHRHMNKKVKLYLSSQSRSLPHSPLVWGIRHSRLNYYLFLALIWRLRAHETKCIILPNWFLQKSAQFFQNPIDDVNRHTFQNFWPRFMTNETLFWSTLNFFCAQSCLSILNAFLGAWVFITQFLIL